MKATTNQTKNEAREMILAVLRDGNRNDRNLRMADDGSYFTTPDKTFIGDDGPHTPLYVAIPVAYDTTEEQEEEWADSLIADLNEKIAEAKTTSISEMGRNEENRGCDFTAIWNACVGPVFLVVQGKYWLYVDDVDGYEVMNTAAADGLILVAE